MTRPDTNTVLVANAQRVRCDCGKDPNCIYCNGTGEKILQTLIVPPGKWNDEPNND